MNETVAIERGLFRRRWLRFSLRTMLAAVTAAGIGLGLWLEYAERERQRSAVAAVATLEKSLAYVWFESAPTQGEWAPAEWEQKFQNGNYPTDIARIEFHDTATDADLAPLRSLTNVKSFVLGGTNVTDAGLANVSRLTTLEELSLGVSIGDAGLAHLTRLTSLRSLSIGGSNVTDAGLGHLGGLTSLTRLSLVDVRLSRQGLKPIAGLTSLEELTLRGIDLRAVDFAPLRRLTNLRELRLDSGVDDADLQYIGALTSLESLDLSTNRVSDAGLMHLRGLTNLKVLRLECWSVTEVGIRQLRQLLPKCQIHWWDGIIYH